MDLRTNYLGMELKNPVVPSASPLAEHLDNLKLMEDAGAAAVVLPSLFEEQLIQNQVELNYHLEHGTESFAEALSYFPEAEDYDVGPDQYLELIRSAKESLEIPVIASLNGSSLSGWTDFAKQMEQAGANAIELNIYRIPTDINLSGSEVEAQTVEVVKAVKRAVNVPVAVKLGPYYSNMANMAKQLDEAGADGLVLFNRFYQPDIDLDDLEVRPNVLLSTPQAMRLPLRWIAILHGRINADLAATSGIHDAEDVIKMLMVGANVTMMASTLFRHGLDYIGTVLGWVEQWMEDREYDSVEQMRGSLSQLNSPNPAAFERAQYVRAVSSIPDNLKMLYNIK